MTIKIEKGVPMPTFAACRRYPFDEMEVGDSFLVDAPQPTVSSAAGQAGKRLGRTFRTRKTREGVRCWRVA